MTEPKITLKKLSEFGYEKENDLFLSSPKMGKLTLVLKRIAKNKEIKSLLKEALSKQYDKELSKIYVNYFTD